MRGTGRPLYRARSSFGRPLSRISSARRRLALAGRPQYSSWEIGLRESSPGLGFLPYSAPETERVDRTIAEDSSEANPIDGVDNTLSRTLRQGNLVAGRLTCILSRIRLLLRL